MRRPKTASEISGAVDEDGLERVASSLDRAIRAYEIRYRLEQSPCYGSYRYQDPYAGRYRHPTYAQPRRNMHPTDQLLWVLADYEASLQSLEHGLPDLDAIRRYAQGLRGVERQSYIAEWTEYLRSQIGLSSQLEDALTELAEWMAQEAPRREENI